MFSEINNLSYWNRCIEDRRDREADKVSYFQGINQSSFVYDTQRSCLLGGVENSDVDSLIDKLSQLKLRETSNGQSQQSATVSCNKMHTFYFPQKKTNKTKGCVKLCGLTVGIAAVVACIILILQSRDNQLY